MATGIILHFILSYHILTNLAAHSSITPAIVIFLCLVRTMKRMRPVCASKRRLRGFKTRNTIKTYLVFLGSCAMTMKPLNIMWKYIIKLTLPTQFIYYLNDIYTFTERIPVLTDTYNYKIKMLTVNLINITTPQNHFFHAVLPFKIRLSRRRGGPLYRQRHNQKAHLHCHAGTVAAWPALQYNCLACVPRGYNPPS